MEPILGKFVKTKMIRVQSPDLLEESIRLWLSDNQDEVIIKFHFDSDWDGYYYCCIVYHSQV